MYYRLNQHLQINNILVGEQYGFRKGLSTEYAAHSLTNSILTAWSNELYVGGIFCDLTKVFDCVDHNMLKMKLQYYGLHKETINWFESYSSCRKQRVRLQINRNDTYFSAWKLVKQGVPQGLVLGPLLFIIYINDLPLGIEHISDVLFADDTSVLVVDKSYEKFKQKLISVMSCLENWFNGNELVLNIAKTNFMSFTPGSFAHVPLAIEYKNILIKEVTTTKFLGMRIDTNMNWKKHIEHILPKLASVCYAVGTLYNSLNSEALCMVDFACFHSVINYGLIFWGNSTNVQ
jgi:hypothetical protein